MKLTDTERSLLIWFHNNINTITLDQGNILHAYGKITNDPYDKKNKFLPTVTGLIEKGMIERNPPPLDCFYMISEKGEKHLNDTIEPSIFFQCTQCGDLWSLDIDDPMILEAYLVEHPNGTTIEELCESCEIENEKWRHSE